MRIIPILAIKNILAHKRRSLLIGLTIFCATFLLLLSNAAMNGVQSQVLRGYLNLQSGHVAIIWEDVKEISNTEPGRFINTIDTISFDINKDEANQAAILRMDAFLENHSQIQAVYPTIRRHAQFFYEDTHDSFIAYGLNTDSMQQLLDTHTVAMKAGSLLSPQSNAIAISAEKAEKFGLRLGDQLSVEGITIAGERNEMNVEITGIYENSAGYNNWYGFMWETSAKDLFAISDPYFDIVKIYLNDMTEAETFASELDQYLLESSPMLRAESYEEASVFYTTMPKLYKSVYTIFILFLLSIIAVGLRSIVRINVYERMREFGMMRAIGYSRPQSFGIIFFEIFCLSVVSLAIAVVTSTILVKHLENTGVYVGPGDLANALGGESFYPILQVGDILIAFVVILIFSLISTLTPGMKLCYQKITDILVKRQKKVSVIRTMIRERVTSRLNTP